MNTMMHRLGVISSMLFVVLISIGIPACTDEIEDLEESGEQESAQESAPEQAGTAPEKGTSAAYYCAPGYHGHFVDWSATRIVPWGACDSSNGLVKYGHPICMLDGNGGYSACGYWWVRVYSPANGLYGAIKIHALNGH